MTPIERDILDMRQELDKYVRWRQIEILNGWTTAVREEAIPITMIEYTTILKSVFWHLGVY